MTQMPSNALERIAIIGEGVDDSGQRYLKLAVSGSKVNLPPYSTADQLEPKKRLFPELGNAGCRASLAFITNVPCSVCSKPISRSQRQTFSLFRD